MKDAPISDIIEHNAITLEPAKSTEETMIDTQAEVNDRKISDDTYVKIDQDASNIVMDESIAKTDEEVVPLKTVHEGGRPIRENRENWKTRFVDTMRPVSVEHHDRVRNVYNMTIAEAIKARGADMALTATKAELQQLKDKNCFVGKTPEEVRILRRHASFKIIPMKVFLKDKKTLEGVFEKLEHLSTYCRNAIALHDTGHLSKGTSRITTDVPAACINASREGQQALHMCLDKTLSKLMIEMDPAWGKYLQSTIIAEVIRALYGLIEPAKLWFEEISGFLRTIGFTANPCDPCVLNLDFNGKQCTLVLYVDDCFVDFVEPRALEFVCEKLSDKYGKVTRHDGDVLPFLGMMLDFREEVVVKFSMPAYLKDIIRGSSVKRPAETPAAANLFEVDPESPIVSEEVRKIFRSQVAKLLHLAKKVRVDIVPVNYLCARVNQPTLEDVRKLTRVQRYLLGSKDLCMRRGVGDNFVFIAYIDASYGTHVDGKSHSGMILTLEGGTILAKSSYQSILTKSSTEAEVVAASDCGTDLIAAEDFLVHQGHTFENQRYYNISAIQLLKNGKRSSDRTKHMDIRYFWLKERVDTNEIKVEHLPTDSMWVDMLTKTRYRVNCLESSDP